MRVIAGMAGGRPLAGPPGPRTRPTSDKVKGALFSMLESLLAAERFAATGASVEPGSPDLWEGLAVLDLYAGTGALGIEALSRGAGWCDFVEANAAARRTIQHNLEVTGLADSARVIGLDVERVLRAAAAETGGEALLASFHLPYGVILLDPPYADLSISDQLRSLAAGRLPRDGALVAIEHSRRLALAPRFQPNGRGVPLVERRQRRHGDTVVSIYRFGEAADEEEGSHGGDGDLSGEL